MNPAENTQVSKARPWPLTQWKIRNRAGSVNQMASLRLNLL
jgi:hypothetical protein